MLLVFDCSSLIDLREGEVLPNLRELRHQLFICDVNADELKQKSRIRWKRHLREAGVTATGLPSDGVVRLMELAERYRRPGRKDLFALALGLYLGAALVTGDADLRKAAESESCPVHGTLWLLDEMVRRGVINGAAADAGLVRMMNADRRIPAGLAKNYQEAWRRGQPYSSQAEAT
ncbi:MAG: hypothetical protein GXP48_12520 [Acidobacteria bacterium]|nr:hypothetical protein [Acidobacteriota bacterium]